MAKSHVFVESEGRIMLARRLYVIIAVLATVAAVLVVVNRGSAESKRQQIRLGPPAQSHAKSEKLRNFDAAIVTNANELLADGRETFRFDTFGDEVFWGDTLQLHQAIKGANLGGVGPGISPASALSLGLKVDLDARSEEHTSELQSRVD